MVEQGLHKTTVTGSNPVAATPACISPARIAMRSVAGGYAQSIAGRLVTNIQLPPLPPVRDLNIEIWDLRFEIWRTRQGFA